MAAAHAKPEMKPGVADLQAIFTAVGAWRYFTNLIKMSALVRHDCFSLYGTACGSKRVILFKTF